MTGCHFISRIFDKVRRDENNHPIKKSVDAKNVLERVKKNPMERRQ